MFVKPIAEIGGRDEPARKDTDIQARSENAPSLFLHRRKWQFVVMFLDGSAAAFLLE